MDHATSAGEGRENLVLRSTSRDVDPGSYCTSDRKAAPQPFAWQDGNRVLLFDRDGSTWLVAELNFESDKCLYTELRRASYQSQREAIGAFLSRALAGGDTALVDAVERLDRYMTRHYQVDLINA
jgi:hypothetical protein